MSDTLPCPRCDADIPVGSFPVFEGAHARCDSCQLALIVAVETDHDAPHGGWARLREMDE